MTQEAPSLAQPVVAPEAATGAMAQRRAQRGQETHALSLALLLLRLSACIVLAPALLLALLAALVARPRRAAGLWYLSESDQAAIEALPAHALRAVRRALAIIGWAVAGCRNRGMRAHGAPHAAAASTAYPNCVPRAPPPLA